MKSIVKSAIILSAVALVMNSCGDKNYYYGEDDSRKIALSSRVTLNPEARLQELQIESGQELSLYITPSGNTTELLYANVNIIANGSGGFTAQTMYYPIDGRNIDLYAIHPYSATASLTNAVDFAISADQYIQKNYLNSDLLHATAMNKPRSGDPISMVFSHKLSKIDFTIVSNDVDIDLAILNGVQVLNTRPATTINMINGNISPATGNVVSVDAYGAYGSPEARNSVTGIHAIIVPQTIPAGTQLFRIIVGRQSYIYTTTEEIEFESGLQYSNTLTITAGQITLESSITEWGDGGSIGGGVQPEPIP